MRGWWLLSVVVFSACGSETRFSTSPTPPTPAPTTYTLTGAVTSLQTGAGLSGLSVNGVTTDGSGRYSLTTQGGRLALEATGAAIVPRKIWAQVSGTRDVDLSAIALDGTFDLEFYRQFARGSVDHGTLQPIRRLTEAPRIYLRTVDDQGATIGDATLAMVEATIRETAVIWSAGAFGVAGFERGTDTRENQPGWLTVKWFATDDLPCGEATLGQDGGWMRFNARRTRCRCSGALQTADVIVRHELGHAFGYYHTASSQDMMTGGSLTCQSATTARERYHAAIMYARPVGNQDPDADPSTAVALQAVVTAY